MSDKDIRKQAAQIFMRAAAYIRKYGWQVSGMSKHGKPRCSMGALASACSEEKWDKNISKLMYETLYKELDGITLTQFNHKFKSGDKVARLFECTAQSIVR